MHTDSGKRRGRSRQRILYWFRTPPGVRIGRSALDEEAIKLIEEHNPEVEFDWTRILKGQESPAESRPVHPNDRRGRSRPREAPRPGPSQPPPRREASPGPQVEPEAAAPFDAPGPAAAAAAGGHPPVPPDVPATIEELLAEPAPAETAEPVPTAAQARLGSEGLSRLRARHAEVLARISETVADPARADELKAQAERLNPDTWVTDDEVTAGIEAYETVFESLRAVVGHRRRRRRRPGGHEGGAPADGSAAGDGSAPAPGEPEPTSPDRDEDL